MLLALYFPTEKQFMIKPQAKLRPPLLWSEDIEESLDDDPDQSFDPYHQPVQTRSDGPEMEVFEPDFLVVEGSQTMDDDIPFFLLEAKRDDLSMGAAVQQTWDYLTRMWGIQKRVAKKHGHEVEVMGMLVMGQDSLIFTLGGGMTRMADKLTETSGSEVCNMLQRLQEQHQDRASAARS
ncbi:hypothetical protein K439DRAFT_1637103 [Ramaria rubella]|nr:hypothetical protein K439DRAFT_1637103 [Ramaria rubella]